MSDAVSAVDFLLKMGNERQTITDSGGGGADSFKLNFDGVGPTALILETATAATVQTALEGLANIAAGDVVVTGAAGGPWTVEFKQEYAGQNVPLLVVSDLTGGLSVVIAETTKTYVTLAGQTGASLSRTIDEADTTNKDSLQWHEGIPIMRNWSIEADALVVEDDLALLALEEAYDNKRTVHVEVITPATNKYQGDATLSSWDFDGPHDGILTASASLTGTAALAKV